MDQKQEMIRHDEQDTATSLTSLGLAAAHWLARRVNDQPAEAPERRIPRLALIIDGYSTTPDTVIPVIAEASKFGFLAVRVVYGDWQSSRMDAWRDACPKHSIETRQRMVTASTRSDTADISLVIDVMDMLYQSEPRIDGFCMVVSQSAYAPLVARVLRSGASVVVFGDVDTPEMLRNAGTVFVEIPRARRRRKTSKPSRS